MTAGELIKDLMQASKEITNAPLKLQIAEHITQILEMQEEISRLKEENAELKKQRDLSEKIIRHDELYVTRSDENQQRKYCSCCWDTERKLVQISCDKQTGRFECPNCKNHGVYDREINDRIEAELHQENEATRSFLEYNGFN